MKEIKKQSEGVNYSSIEVGAMNELNEHVFTLAPGVEILGKVFVGEALHTTGAEMSFQIYAPGQETGFLHTHKTHEELYLFVKGWGEFQVDGEVFPIKEGSVVRVAPKGKRALRNNGSEPLVMICVQYKSNSFSADDAKDGEILEEKVQW